MSVGVIKDGQAVQTAGNAATPKPVTGVGTLATGFTGACTWTRQGDIVTVCLTNITGVTAEGNGALVTNLPAPLNKQLAIVAFDSAGLINHTFVDKYDSGPMGGVIRPYSGSQAYNGLYGSATYIAEPEEA